MRKGKFVCLGALMAALLTAYVLSGRPEKIEIPNDPQTNFQIFAGCYPAYALSSMIIHDIPGMNLYQLTQPQMEGYGNYELSDWEWNLLAGADGLILLGSGYEGFEASCAGAPFAIIRLLNGMALETFEGCACLDLKADGQSVIPWPYLSIEGSRSACEAVCANMQTLDELYAPQYYDNLTTALERLNELEKSIRTDLLSGKSVGVMHEAFYYTASELGAERITIIRRNALSELSNEEIDACIELFRENGVTLVLAEQHMPSEIGLALRDAGFTVAELDLMLDHTEKDGFEGLLSGLYQNWKAVAGAL